MGDEGKDFIRAAVDRELKRRHRSILALHGVKFTDWVAQQMQKMVDEYDHAKGDDHG